MSDINSLKAGDVVRLKSGGPAMTVRAVTENSVRVGEERSFNVACNWFAVSSAMEAEGKLEHIWQYHPNGASFDSRMLEVVKPADQG